MSSSKRRRERTPASGVGPERSSVERSETERSGGPTPEGTREVPPCQVPLPPDPEVLEKALRRQYPAEYKLRVVREADACTQPGELGALLRREGLYSSHLSAWRQLRDSGALSALSSKLRGPKAKENNPLARRLAELEAENQKLKKRLQEAQVIIEFQKKVSDVLGIPLSSPENGGKI